MSFEMTHTNINVLDMEKSINFYNKALGLAESRRKTAEDGSFLIVYLTDSTRAYELELTWLKDKKHPYDLGDNESHIAFKAKDFDAAKAMHKEMGCICFENPEMGIYFIEDPDGYWLEVL